MVDDYDSLASLFDHNLDVAQEAVKKRHRPRSPIARLLWELLWKLLRRREVIDL
ncbi:hypothetical protein HanHA300_Chr13g0502691 [Helianthus annuus]|nr:hypothetical protein HanHA300_Chr13g0502691 [Helianthus annuus]KAJ0499561.1 hypothetical protein HanHA89_Chr13g0535411 [Helianthus annuus]KAJ0665575.1 hypothetical protein HanLR1_Chr13g0505401 [Helianthus annuus]KAJ0673023.1 hypothetical protein HanOQP8_Chr13g0503621 [Helianthus annuus]